MSETTTDPQGGAETPAEPAATESPAPAETGAATETTETTEEPPKPSRQDRRIAALSARLSAGEVERAKLAAEVETYRQRLAPEPPKPITADDIPRIVEERVANELTRREAVQQVEKFHEAGKAAFPDWQDRCNSLMQMGADAPFAQLLVETPDGARVTAALADDPEEMERIVGLKTERARAIALGKFAASLPERPAPVSRNVSRAPEPIRPINGASARATFNEHTATTQQLVEFYSKQAMQKRGLN